jgi:uncharacterized protein YggE
MSTTAKTLRRFFLTFTVLAFALAAPSPAQQDRAVDQRTISTSGEAVVYVVPDQAIVSFGVETFDADLDKAVATNASACAKLVKAVKELGIEEKHIATDTLSVSIRYQNYDHPTRGVEGYVAVRSYAVTLKDVKQLEKLVQTGLHSGANLLQGVDLRTTELRKHRDNARQMAVRAAKEKAVLLAKELDATIGKPRSIAETGFSYWGYSNRGYNAYGNAQVQAQVAAPAGGDAAGEGGEAMPLGQIGVRATVSVTFDLHE